MVEEAAAARSAGSEAQAVALAFGSEIWDENVDQNNSMRQLPCAHGSYAEARARLSLANAQREINEVSVGDLCRFGGPGNCPYFQRAIDTAINSSLFSR
jgi:hypothetical protein